MTFTYDLSSHTDLTRVRYHLADVTEADAIWSDEEITFAIELYNGSWQEAVIGLIEQQITSLARIPDFKADWLSINSSSSIKSWQHLLSSKRQEFGLTALASRAIHTYRADSREYQSPDYTEDNDAAI